MSNKNFIKYIRLNAEKSAYLQLSKIKQISDASELRLSNICTKHQYAVTLAALSAGVEITDLNAPILMNIFERCKKILFPSKNTPNISFYIIPDNQPNAGCVFLGDDTYMININSALIDLCSEGELAFVIGHELGHLKFNHHKLTAASADDNLSAILRSRLLEYNRMCEITADRAGFICSNLTDATQALFKLAIGTKSSLIQFNYSQITSQLNNLQSLLEDKTHLRQSKFSHPYSLIRLLAIYKFDAFINNEHKKNNDITLIDVEITDSLEMMSPKAYKAEELLLMYGCLWVAYSDKDAAELEIQSIYSFCKTEMVDDFQAELALSNKPLMKIKNIFKSHLKKNSSISQAAKATILEKLLCVARADNFIRNIELESVREISNLLKLEKLFVESSIKKLTKSIGL